MADKQGVSHQERKALREKLATPNRIGQTIACSDALWSRRKSYLNDGWLMIGNNLAGNAIRL